MITAYRGNGDSSPLDELIRRHLPTVRRIILPMVGNAATADDLTQETFLRALRNLHRFEGKAEFRTWLTRIAMNVARDHLRRMTSRPVSKDEGLQDLTTREPDGFARLSSCESIDDIARAMQQLPDAMRMALTLVCINELTPAEAAELENCSTATIYWRIHQSRKRLKRLLSK